MCVIGIDFKYYFEYNELVQFDQYRNGAPNDEGFYCYNQSRYKKYGVKWGEFYLVHNSDWRKNFPNPIKTGPVRDNLQHYLFYFRDETFECIASSYDIEFC